MSYNFYVGFFLDALKELSWGALLTLRLSAFSMGLSLTLAVAGAFACTSGPRWLRALVLGYVELIRNTPFLVQIFMIFYGLPVAGLRLDADDAALLAMVLNGSAYTVEIVRAGIESVPHGQVEAACSLGLSRVLAFRLVILPQALAAAYAPLCSQFMLLMLGSSVVSVISANELMAVAEDVQGRTFRPFEVYILAGAVYLLLSLAFSAVFDAIERAVFARPASR
jgi:polar amino acid transport system permease protein